MKEFALGQASNSPKVSIIIPVYNVEPYVGECIESVMAQDAQIPMECIVVDDRGTDNSMAVVNQLVDAYQGPIEFRIVTREKNGGLSAARNSGIDVARGEYLYFVDSDDTITPDAIRLLWQQVEAHPGVDMVVGAAKCFPTPDLDEYLNLNKFEHLSYSCDKNVISRYFLKIPEIACSKLFRVRFLKDNNLTFKEGIIHEDLHQHLRISCHIQSIAFSEAVTYNYRMRQGSIMKKSNKISQHKTVLLIIDDLINTKYTNKNILSWILIILVDYGLEIQFDTSLKPISTAYTYTLRNLIEQLSFKRSIPFRYLRLKRPWMRVAILKQLANICFK